MKDFKQADVKVNDYVVYVGNNTNSEIGFGKVTKITPKKFKIETENGILYKFPNQVALYQPVIDTYPELFV